MMCCQRETEERRRAPFTRWRRLRKRSARKKSGRNLRACLARTYYCFACVVQMREFCIVFVYKAALSYLIVTIRDRDGVR